MSPLCSLILLLSVLAEGVCSRRSDVTWNSPSKGKSFGPGDAIICKWKVDEALVSPSFQLCMRSDDSPLEERGSDENKDSDMNCGATVWPTVEGRGDEYTSSLVVPDAIAEGNYTLRIKDDFGSKYDTPSFFLQTTSTSATDSVENPSAEDAQVPLGSPPASSSSSAASGTKSSDPSSIGDTTPSATIASAVDPTAVPLSESSDDGNVNPSATKVVSSSARPYPSTSAGSISQGASGPNASFPPSVTSTPRVADTNPPLVTPQDLASRRPQSTAAFAIPLSVIGVILVIAAGLAFRHRRKLAEERTTDAEKIALSRQSSISSYKSAGEVQYALGVLSRHEIGYGAAPAPVPLFMPVERGSVRREPRRSTKREFEPTSYILSSHRPRTESIAMSRSRPLLTRSGLSSRRDVHTLHGANEAAGWNEDPATHSVIADYILPSPPLPSSQLVTPQRVYMRNDSPCVPAYSKKDSYDDKPLPLSPRS